MARGRGRSTNPLSIAAAAVTRALDPIDPSRVTVLRLLADALHLLADVVDEMDVADGRPASDRAYTSNAYISGAEDVAAAAFTCLMRLGAKGGPLRQRAVALFRLAASAVVDTPFLSQAAVDARTHISGLRKDATTTKDAADAQVASAVLILAEASDPRIAGRDVAKDSIFFLLGGKAKISVARRSDVAIAAAVIISAHAADDAPPDDETIDKAVEYALASASTRMGVGGIGSALLIGACAPFLSRRRGAQSLAQTSIPLCALSLALSPTPAEANVWAISLARVVVMSEWKLPVAAEAPAGALSGFSKFLARRHDAKPREKEKKGQKPAVPPLADVGFNSDDGSAGEDVVPVPSAHVFEASLDAISTLCLQRVSTGSVSAIAAVLRMWVCALPSDAPRIPARAVAVLEKNVQTSEALRVALDAVKAGVWEDIRPCDAPAVLTSLVDMQVSGNLSQALVLFLAAEIVHTFEGDAVSLLQSPSRELDAVLDCCQSALAANFSTLRLGGVALVTRVATAAPQLRAMLLTVALQNLRIADLQLATPAPRRGAAGRETEDGPGEQEDSSALTTAAAELSALLGNAAAIACLTEEVSWRASTPPLWRGEPATADAATVAMAVPAALLAQCASDAEALLFCHPISASPEPRGAATVNVRRRAGWALLAALSKAGVEDCFNQTRLLRLIPLWQKELCQPRLANGGGGGEGAEDSADGTSSSSTSGPRSGVGDQVVMGEWPSEHGANVMSALVPEDMELGDVTSASACRSAALAALAACLRVCKTKEFRDLASALLGATAGRIAIVDAGIAPPESSPSQFWSLVSSASSLVGGPDITAANGEIDGDGRRAFRPGFPGIKEAGSTSAEGRKENYTRTIARLCVIEAERLLECLRFIAPTGPSAEICYHIAAAVGNEAQRTIGDAAGVLSAGGSVSGNPSQAFLFSCSRMAGGFVMVNESKDFGKSRSQASIESERYMFSANAEELMDGGLGTFQDLRSIDAGKVATKLGGVPAWLPFSRRDLGWLFSTSGMDYPLAERALGTASEAIGTLIASDLSVTGSLLESLVSSSTLSPAFSASISLALARRLCLSDMTSTGTGRALASLQVLLRRGLTGTMALIEMSGDSLGRDGRQDDDTDRGAPAMMPGSVLLSQVGRLGWQNWARSFIVEMSAIEGGGCAEEFRILNFSSVVRTLTAEAYGTLGKQGGSVMWLGLTRGVVNAVRGALGSSALSQVALVANGATVLGILLDAAPDVPLESSNNFGKDSSLFTLGSNEPAESSAVREVAHSAVEVLGAALEVDDEFVKAAAAAALSDVSVWVAANSERLLANLLVAWAAHEGGSGLASFNSVFIEESAIATLTLRRAWSGMSGGGTDVFFEFSPQGPGTCVGSFGMGAAAVLTACRQHWWPFGESCAGAAAEIAGDLFQWDPASSPRSVAAGFYCLAALWAARIDALRAEESDDSSISADSLSSYASSPRASRVPRASRSPRPARSPRSHSRPSLDCPVPPSPLVPSSAFGNHFLDEFDPELAQETKSSSDRYLPGYTFDLGEVSCLKALNKIVECVAVSGQGSCSREVRSAGVAALTQLVRGAGPRAALQMDSNLPEALFCAFQGGAAGADLVLQHLVLADGLYRLEYWVRLCREVYFGENDFAKGSLKGSSSSERVIWTGGCRTRAMAVATTRLAIEAMTSSLDSEFSGRRTRDTRSLHFCAGDIIDLASTACLSVESSPEAAKEGCRLISCIVLALGDSEICHVRKDQISTALQHSMRDVCPYSVVREAVSATASLLVSGPFFDAHLFHALIGSGRPEALHLMYKYDRFSEDVGAEAGLATFGEIASVVISAIHGAREEKSRLLLGAVEPVANVLYRLFVALVGDFVSLLGDGVSALAREGGSLTVAGVADLWLESSLMKYIGPIALAAAALGACLNASVEESELNIAWCNPCAPGALLVCGKFGGGASQREEVVLSVCIWLINQQSEPDIDEEGRNSFCDLADKALSPLLCNGKLSVSSRIECLSALSALDTNTALSVCANLGKKNLESADGKLIRTAFAYCTRELSSNPEHINLGTAFEAAADLLPLIPCADAVKEGGRNILDLFMFLIGLPAAVSLRQLARKAVQKSMVRAILSGIAAVDDPAAVESLFARLRSLIERLLKVDLNARLDALMAAAASLGVAYPEKAGALAASCLELGDAAVDSILVCSGGSEFIQACLSGDGRVRPYLTTPLVASVLAALTRRMSLGRGPPRQAAVGLLLDLHSKASNGEAQEALLSTLVAPLAVSLDSGRPGASEVLRQLAEADGETFVHAAGSLEEVQRVSVGACIT